RAEEEERRRREREESARRQAEEEARLQKEAEARRRAEEEARRRAPQTADVAADDEEEAPARGRGAPAPARRVAAPEVARPVRPRGEADRRRGKLTLTSALSAEDGDARARSAGPRKGPGPCGRVAGRTGAVASWPLLPRFLAGTAMAARARSPPWAGGRRSSSGGCTAGPARKLFGKATFRRRSPSRNWP